MIALPHFTRSILLRSLAAWGFVRVAAAGQSVLAAALAGRSPPPDPFAVTVPAAVLVVALAGAATMLAARLRNEDLFLATLGYGRTRTIGVAVLLPALLEIAAGALAG